MDTNSTEVSLMLDTYAAEALSIGFVDHPLTITFSDSKAEQDVLSILNRANFFNETLSNVRSLAKYGDLFYRITVDEEAKDLNVKKLTPDQVTAVSVDGFKGVLGYKINTLTGDSRQKRTYNSSSPVIKDHVLKPWDIAQFTIFSDDFAPYGKSELEKVRSAYDQLITMEALFAISRANRVERIVIKVPTNLSNPTSAFAKLQQLKGQIKSVVLGQSSQTRFSANKEWGLTDILFMPADENFDIDKLSSSIDISSDEDVRYFLEKMINGSRLPKGFFSGDEVTDRGSMLQQQDLKFSRSIIPLQQAYVSGVVKLCTILAILKGHKDVQVKASLEKPTQITEVQVKSYSDQISVASNYIKTYMEIAMPDELGPAPTPEGDQGTKEGDEEQGPPKPQMMVMPKKISPQLFISIMMKFGIPESIATSILETDTEFVVPNSKVSSDDSLATFNAVDDKKSESIKSSSLTENSVLYKYIKENYSKVEVVKSNKTRASRLVEVELK